MEGLGHNAMNAKTFVPRPHCTAMSGGCFTAGHCLGECRGRTVNKITQLKPVPALPPDLPGRLRQMADDVEAGRVTAMVVGYVCEDSYEFLWPSSLTESLTITALLQASALDRFRR
jgi:hypothetical protein